VPEQLLNGADVSAASEQASGEGVAKGVGADGLRQTGTANGHLDGFVDDAGVHVVATGDTGTRIYGEIPGEEGILPALLLSGMRSLPIQRIGQVDLAMPPSRILVMQRRNPGQVILEQRRKGGGKAGEPVLVALT
jgi:hypothetical protein